MPSVVTDNCEGCRFTQCVTVCPVDCFHMDDKRTYIDPEECIDCGACIPECPVEAIYAEEDLPPDKEKWAAINAEKAAELPSVTEKQEPLPTAEARKKEMGF